MRQIDEEVAKRLQEITGVTDPLRQTTGDLSCDEYALGCLFYASRGCPIDKSRAVSYFKSAADRGHAEAQFMHGLALCEGRSIPPDKKLAAYYFKLSADQGHSQAQSEYAFMFYRGDGIASDTEKSAYYFKLSAGHGDRVAQYMYGH
jgi:TPR repeat protein